MKTKVSCYKRKGKVVKSHSRKVSWKFGGKTYSGVELKNKETSTHRFALTHNNKIKRLPK
jgi:hypothetical protein